MPAPSVRGLDDDSPEPHLTLIANVSTLFTDVPYGRRFEAAAAAGFSGVESWWPFDAAVPETCETDAFVEQLQAAGVRLVGLNLFAGEFASGERGILSDPMRRDDFRANLDALVEIAKRTGCRVFNALHGRRRPDLDPAEQDLQAIENLAHAARILSDVGGTVLIEPLSPASAEDYPIRTTGDAAHLIERVRDRPHAESIGMLFDTFHLAANGEDLSAAIREHGALISHVQLADFPGRGEPGSGGLEFDGVLRQLWSAGYRGAVSAEYLPTTRTESTLGWITEIPLLIR